MAQAPPGWQPTGNGGYRNPASGTVIYPDGRGGWTGVDNGGSAQSGLPPDYGAPGHAEAPPRIRDAGSGRPGNAAVAAKSHIFSMTPRARQAYLRSMGFRVNVDGKSGPQTAAAAWAFVHGHSSGWFNNQSPDWQQSIWNQHFAQYHKPEPGDPNGAAPQSGTGKQKDPNNRTPQDAGNQQFSGSMPGGGLDPGLGQDLGRGIAGLYGLATKGTLVDPRTAMAMGTMLDPNASGSAAAEAQYGQALRDAQRQVSYLPKQAAQDQADLTSWYNILGNKMSKFSSAESAMADTMIGQSKGDTAGLVNAMGGDANLSSHDIGAVGANNVADLQGLKLAGAEGNSELAQAIAASGVTAKVRQRILDQNALTDAQRGLEDTRTKYGAAQTQAMNDAITANNALAQARLQAKMGIIGANNNVYDQRAQRLAGAISAEEGAATLPATIGYKSAEAARAAAAANGTGGKLGSNQPKGAWVNLNGSQRQKLSQTAITSVQAGVKAKDSIPNIVSKVINYYRSQGLHPANNPEVAQAILGALQAGGIQPQKNWAIVQWAHLGR